MGEKDTTTDKIVKIYERIALHFKDILFQNLEMNNFWAKYKILKVDTKLEICNGNIIIDEIAKWLKIYCKRTIRSEVFIK